MSEPMTDDDLAAIGAGDQRALAAARPFGRGALVGAEADRHDLLAEVHRLQDGIRTKAEAWDRDAPDALAFRVTADFRDLIGDDDE